MSAEVRQIAILVTILGRGLFSENLRGNEKVKGTVIDWSKLREDVPTIRRFVFLRRPLLFRSFLHTHRFFTL